MKGGDKMKKVISILMCFAVLFSAVNVFAEDTSFTRIEALRLMAEKATYGEKAYDCPFTDIAEEDKLLVGYAFEKGWIKGTGDNLFNPQAIITRECFLTMVLRSLNYTDPISFTWDNPYPRAFIAGIYPVKYEGAFTIEEAKDILENKKSALSIYSMQKENGTYRDNLSYVSSQITKLEYLFFAEECTIVTGYITGTPHGVAPKGCVVYKADGKILSLTLPRINPWKGAAAENVYLNEDNTKLYYTCTVEKDYIGMDGVTVIQAAGVFEYCVDLVAREITVEKVQN